MIFHDLSYRFLSRLTTHEFESKDKYFRWYFSAIIRIHIFWKSINKFSNTWMLHTLYHYKKVNIFHPGWLGVAKVSCILRHRGVQLILAYSCSRPAILIAGKGRGGMFLFLLFLHFHSSFFPVRLFHLLYYLFYLFSPFLWETTKNDQQEDVSLNPNTINQYISPYLFGICFLWKFDNWMPIVTSRKYHPFSNETTL